jgi:hypothetical protein
MRAGVYTAAVLIVTAMIACAQGQDPNAAGDTTGGDGTDSDGGGGSGNGNVPPDGYDGGNGGNQNTTDSGSSQTGKDSGSTTSKEGGTTGGTDAGTTGKDSGGTVTPGMGDCTDQSVGSSGDQFCDQYYQMFMDSPPACTHGGNECAPLNNNPFGFKYCCYLSPPGSTCATDVGAPACVSP